MKLIDKEIWNDPVWSKVIAAVIISVPSALVATITNWLVDYSGNSIGLSLFIILVSLIAILFLLLVLNWLINRIQKARGIKYFKEAIRYDFPIALEAALLENAPHIERIGIIGQTEVGKTTLIKNIIGEKYKTYKTTETVGAYIHNFSNTKDKYGAILDGAGQITAQQNQIASNSHILILMLDHNISSNSTSLDEERIEAHEQLIFQVYGELKLKQWTPKHILILINKKDLWLEAPADEQIELKNFVDEQVNYLQDNLDSEFTILPVSVQAAGNVNDIKRFIEKLLL